MDQVLQLVLVTLLVTLVTSSPYGPSLGTNPNYNNFNHQGAGYGNQNPQAGSYQYGGNGQQQPYPNTGNNGHQGAFGSQPQQPHGGNFGPNQQYTGQGGQFGQHGNHQGGYKTHGY